MPFYRTVDAFYNGRCQCCSGGTQKRDICSRDSFDVTWVLSYREFCDLESKMVEEWSMKDIIDAAIWEVNQDFHCTEDTFIVPEELKSFILG